MKKRISISKVLAILSILAAATTGAHATDKPTTTKKKWFDPRSTAEINAENTKLIRELKGLKEDYAKRVAREKLTVCTDLEQNPTAPQLNTQSEDLTKVLNNFPLDADRVTKSPEFRGDTHNVQFHPPSAAPRKSSESGMLGDPKAVQFRQPTSALGTQQQDDSGPAEADKTQTPDRNQINP